MTGIFHWLGYDFLLDTDLRGAFLLIAPGLGKLHPHSVPPWNPEDGKLTVIKETLQASTRGRATRILHLKEYVIFGNMSAYRKIQ